MIIKVPDRQSSQISDILKALSTIFVVFIHSRYIFLHNPDASEPFIVILCDVIASSGVPVFFLLSGYYLFLKGTIDYSKNTKKKLISLGIPYLAFLSINIVALLIGHVLLPSFELPVALSELTFKNIVLACFGIPFWEGPLCYPPLWFIRELLLLNILSPVISYLIKRKFLRYLLIVMLVTIWFLPLEGELRKSVVFFTLGCILGYLKVYPVLKRSIILTMLSIALAGTLLMYYLKLDIYSILTLFVVMPVFTLCYYIERIPPIRNLASRFLPYSLFIYLLHWYLLLVPQKIIIGYFSTNIVILTTMYFILPLLVIAIIIIAGSILRKVFPKAFTFLSGMRTF